MLETNELRFLIKAAYHKNVTGSFLAVALGMSRFSIRRAGNKLAEAGFVYVIDSGGQTYYEVTGTGKTALANLRVRILAALG